MPACGARRCELAQHRPLPASSAAWAAAAWERAGAAFDRTLKQQVALEDGARPPAGLFRGGREREVRALAELTHPNTVRVFDYGVTEDGLWYYAMELLAGRDLRELVRARGRWRHRACLRIAGRYCARSAKRTKKASSHRDIKPENVFVAELGGEPDVPKLLDFGIAKATDGHDPTLHEPGCRGNTRLHGPGGHRGPPCRRALRHLLFRRHALLRPQRKVAVPDVRGEALFDAHRNRVVPPLSSAAPGTISPELERVIERCMAKNPAERCSSAQALYEELRSVEA